VPPSAPKPLQEHHDVTAFDSGEESLDTWLKRRALANQVTGASRTYVVCEEGRVVGYYALATGSISQSQVSGRFRRNMPDPIPMVLLARLAVDRTRQGKGLGRGLFRDAAMRVSQAADLIGILGIYVHAISEAARAFYLQLGFIESAQVPMTLVITLQDIRANL
jgi:GNAT superfamily N-acetyltransferase